MNFSNLNWHFDYVIAGFLLALIVIDSIYAGFVFRKRYLFFLTGITVLFVCTSFSMNPLVTKYPFSLHMISHISILLIAAPFIVRSLQFNPNTRSSVFRLSSFFATHPLICWMAGVLTMWLWHIPSLSSINAMGPDMMHPNRHMMNLLEYVHLLNLLLGGIIFWLPVLSVGGRKKLSAPGAIIYLSTACISCSVLGLLITFAPAGMFLTHMYMPGTSFATIAEDQQTAGMIMWVPCCFIYLSVSMFILIEWMSAKKMEKNVINEIQKQKLA